MTTTAKLIHSETPGPIEISILTKIQDSFSPTYLKIVNDSYKHAHHAGIRGATNTTESHFNIEIVSSIFEGKTLPTRHRLVYNLLDHEIKHKGVHALQLRTKTESEINKTI